MQTAGRSRHEQVSDWLRRKIELGEFGPDQKLPSENELVRQFNFSRITIRRALQTLEGESLIYKRHGLGTFVSPQKAKQGLVRLTDFLEDMSSAGMTARSEVLRRKIIPASPAVALALNLEIGSAVLQLDRLRYGDDKPMAYDQAWLPPLYAQLLEDEDLEETTIYHVLEEKHNIPILRGKYRLEAANATSEIARHLEVDRGDALLVIQRLTCTHGEVPFYFQRRYYRSDRVAYELQLERTPEKTYAASGGNPIPQKFEPVFRKAEPA